MRIQTSELTGAALDWAVAKCEGISWAERTNNPMFFKWEHGQIPHFSTEWAQGGPIIDREDIELCDATGHHESAKHMGVWRNNVFGFGQTKLIAAMRCYVTSKLGDEVEVPEELL